VSAPPTGRDLAARLPAARTRWALAADGAFRLSYRHVEPVRRADGSAAVLRLGPTGDPALAAAELWAPLTRGR
jgi:hypothetical protein